MKKGLIKSAVSQLGANLLTTLFMCAGIMIGISVLITVIALGQGTSARILERVDRVGAADTFTIRTVPWGQGGGGLRGDHGRFLFSFDDIIALQDNLPGITATLANLNARGALASERLALDDISVQGVAPNFQQIRGWAVQSGVFFSEADIQRGSATAVIGPAIATAFFPGENPLGQALKVEDMALEVIGVLSSRGATGSGRNADEIVLVPQAVFTHLFEPAGLSTVTIMVSDTAAIERLASQAKQFLEQLYPGQEIFVRFSMATARARDEMARTLSLYLTVIAVIALLVGGIVMMNLTSLSVSARIREIGLRKALGARNRDISNQVLLETVMTAIIAGLAGIVLGYILTLGLAASLAAAVTFSLSPTIAWPALIISLFVSVIIGTVAGIYPALFASRLDPVVALRSA